MAERITIIISAHAAQAVKEFDAAAKDFQAAGERIQGVGTALSLGVTLPIAAVGATAIRASAQWETAMTQVAKTVDEPEARIQALGDEFVRMSEAIPVSANELAELGAQAGQLGVETEAIDDFVETVAALGVSTNLSADMAGSSLARLANIMSTAQTDFDRMGSTIVDLGNNLATTESEIVTFGLRIAGAGEVAGLTEADVLAIGAALSSVGVQAEAGGTAVQKALIQMNTAVAQGNDELQIFAQTAGMSAEEFAAQWEDAPIQAFRAFIEGLNTAGDDATVILEELFDRNERLTRSFLALANAGGLLRDSITLANEAWDENTALAEEAEKFYARMGAEFDRLANKARNVAAELGDALAPETRVALEAASDLLDVTRAGIEVFASLPAPVRTTTVAIVALTAALGPGAIALGALVKSWGTLQGLMAAARVPVTLKASTVALRGLGTLLTPGGAVIAGLTALGIVLTTAKLRAAEAEEEFRKLRDRVEESLSGLGLDATLQRLVAAQSQLEGAEERLASLRAQADQQRQDRSFISRGGFLTEGAADPELVDEITRLESQIIPSLEASVEILTPQFQRLQTAQFASAQASREAREEMQAQIASGRTLEASMTTLGGIYENLQERIASVKDEVILLEVTQGNVEVGSERWQELGDQILEARSELELMTETARDLEESLNRITQARLSSLTVSERGIPGIDPNTGLPTQAIGNLGPLTATDPFGQLSAILQRQQETDRASEFGLDTEQMQVLERAAAKAGVTVEELAVAVGLVGDSSNEVAGVIISGVGGMVSAVQSGFAEIEVVVIQTVTNILQTLSQEGGPLGGILGGLGVPIFGAIGGILASVFRDDSRPRPVKVDRFGDEAIRQQRDIQQGPETVTLILTDARGNETRRVTKELRRLSARDGVTRLPDVPSL